MSYKPMVILICEPSHTEMVLNHIQALGYKPPSKLSEIGYVYCFRDGRTRLDKNWQPVFSDAYKISSWDLIDEKEHLKASAPPPASHYTYTLIEDELDVDWYVTYYKYPNQVWSGEEWVVGVVPEGALTLWV